MDIDTIVSVISEMIPLLPLSARVTIFEHLKPQIGSNQHITRVDIGTVDKADVLKALAVIARYKG